MQVHDSMEYGLEAQDQTSVISIVLLSPTSAISSIFTLRRPVSHTTQFVPF
jgi:hypothetical protein